MDPEKAKINNFTDLKVWQEAHKLALIIYQITKDFPADEKFGLISQIRRAVVSITSNIAEGFSRISSKEKLQFYNISRGSLTEVENQLLLAKDLKYVTDVQFTEVYKQLIFVHKLLNSFLKSTRSFNSKFLNS